LSIDPESVRARLNEIPDPCSVTAGCAAGLVDMGMVRAIAVAGDEVRVTLALTEPGCAMALWFMSAIRRELGALPGVASVSVTLDAAARWDESAMTPAAQAVLTRTRLRHREQRTVR
jgi:metal-sulfur cluster biosynthetic enzyme